MNEEEEAFVRHRLGANGLQVEAHGPAIRIPDAPRNSNHELCVAKITALVQAP